MLYFWKAGTSRISNIVLSVTTQITRINRFTRINRITKFNRITRLTRIAWITRFFLVEEYSEHFLIRVHSAFLSFFDIWEWDITCESSEYSLCQTSTITAVWRAPTSADGRANENWMFKHTKRQTKTNQLRERLIKKKKKKLTNVSFALYT